MNKKLMAMVMAGTMALGTAAMVQAEENPYEGLKVGISFFTVQEERWARELDTLESVCESYGIEALSQVAENDPQKQAGQIENLVAQGVDMLIVICNQDEAVMSVLKDAHEQGIFVGYYEKVDGQTYADYSGGNVDLDIGKMITQAAAEAGISGKVGMIYGDPGAGQTLIDFEAGMKESLKDNDIEIVGEQYVTSWDPNTAMGIAENYIAQYGDELAGILCMNDGMAGGAVKALEAADMAGDVIVVGQDCELAACQRILEGTQLSTVLKSGVGYPTQYLENMLGLYTGELTEEDFAEDYNSDGATIPYFVYGGQVITKDNIDVVIEEGVFTAEELYGAE